MTRMTFQQADRIVDELVNQQRYEEALSQLQNMMEDFPEQIYVIAEYIAYLYLLTERPKDAIAEFIRALGRGHFYPIDRTYYKDQIGDLPEYPKLLEKSLELKEQYQLAAKLTWEVFVPSDSATKPYPVIVFLHGDGKNIKMIKSYWTPDAFAEMGYLVVYIQSSRVSKYNSYSWTGDFSLSRKLVTEALEKIGKEYEIDLDQTILAGFSGGSMIALDMTLRQSIPVAKCVALCPGSGSFLDQTSEWNLNFDQDRITIFYGEREFESQKHPVIQKLDQHNVPYKAEILPGIGHWYPPDIVDRTIAILSGVSAKD